MVVCPSTVVSLFLCCGAAVAENRSIDGRGNNLQNLHWGSARTTYSRVSPPAYGDGIKTPGGADRPLPRIVSNAIGHQDALISNDRHLSGFAYAFGQFLNHDLQLTQSILSEFVTITTPSDDPYFHGNVLQPLFRSNFDPNTGLDATNPRQQLNFVTSFIDASSVYGADQNRADLLREQLAGGLGARLVTSGAENLLPLASTINVEIAVTGGYSADRTKLYAAGDLRAGENASLAILHTLFMREHNRLVDELTIEHPAWSQEELYQRARKIVGAELQSVTYNEFLPALLGPQAPSSQGTYDQAVDPSIINEFAAVFLRVGHSMLGNDFRRVTNDGSPGPMDPLRIGETVFNVPQWLSQSADLDLFLKGLSVEESQEVDTLFADEQRNVVLFFIDLMSIDVARARDHGLADYNTMRVAYGLPAVTTFSQITSDPVLASALEQLYGDVNHIDPLIGALAEDHLTGASVGPLAAAGLAEQFVRLRDGDRFWYENDPAFTAEEVLSLRNTRLSDIIGRNTGITTLQDNVFFVPSAPPAGPGDFNNDGTVDAADYVVWRNGLGTTHTQADYDVWRANFGQTAASAASAPLVEANGKNHAVPEPPAAWLVFCGLTIVFAAHSSRPQKTARTGGDIELAGRTAGDIHLGNRPTK
jgi:hypothetical protein